jgi:hypothetical protein
MASRCKEETIYFPCKVCKNVVMFEDCEVIHEHLVRTGFMDNYLISTKHGETQLGTESIIHERAEENMGIPDDVCSHHNDRCEDDICQDDADHSDEGFDVEDLMCNVVPDVLHQRRNKGFDNFEMLDKASKDLLYKECKACDMEHTVLWMTLQLMKLKATSGWSDTSFSALLELLRYCQSQMVFLVAPPSKEDNLSIDLGYRKNPRLPEPLHRIPKRTQIE